MFFFHKTGTFFQCTKSVLDFAHLNTTNSVLVHLLAAHELEDTQQTWSAVSQKWFESPDEPFLTDDVTGILSDDGPTQGFTLDYSGGLVSIYSPKDTGDPEEKGLVMFGMVWSFSYLHLFSKLAEDAFSVGVCAGCRLEGVHSALDSSPLRMHLTTTSSCPAAAATGGWCFICYIKCRWFRQSWHPTKSAGPRRPARCLLELCGAVLWRSWRCWESTMDWIWSCKWPGDKVVSNGVSIGVTRYFSDKWPSREASHHFCFERLCIDLAVARLWDIPMSNHRGCVAVHIGFEWASPKLRGSAAGYGRCCCGRAWPKKSESKP